MPAKVLLITPPFTQLNTPYPATAYLKGFLNTKQISSFQCDLGIEVILQLFSSIGLENIFRLPLAENASANAKRIHALQHSYIDTIERTVNFLQGRNLNDAFQIAGRQYLPEASRFAELKDLQWAYGSMGLHDQAKYIATLYLEDIADYIKECIDPHFGFSRYAEKLGRCASHFDELYRSLVGGHTYIDTILLQILQKHLDIQQPDLVAISVPFPGNLYSAFRCAQFIHQHYPPIKVAMGGGFANTELRSLSDNRVFEFFDFITLDDGELPMLHLIQQIDHPEQEKIFKRTLLTRNGAVVYENNSVHRDFKQTETGTPDYSDLLLDQYISAVEIINPMHKLWSDGKWLKLTMAHGCYWGKCTFCDISLDYIQRYEPLTASLLCERIETLIAQTGERSFHFVDEAAPPSLMKALALEIIKRKIKINWWTNIRFEKSFTEDLCYLLKASGCIAVSGGLEVASDRLLKLIEKGVSVKGVTRVAHNFNKAGIMVHAYLMYGFPTQTVQETINSMETVRQMFETGVLKSAFWHQFAMTAHSPIGLNPANFKVKILEVTLGTFANNDIEFMDETGIDSSKFNKGLKTSLFNYMQGTGFDLPLQKWFDFKIPLPDTDKNYIQEIIENHFEHTLKDTQKIYWLKNMPATILFAKSKKGNTREMMELVFELEQVTIKFSLPLPQGQWFVGILQKISLYRNEVMTLQEIRHDYEQQNFYVTLAENDFELLWHNKILKYLKGNGLIAV